jgi:type IV pilus assembly protein PilY1
VQKEPNVMFVVDTSGSMEYVTGTTLGPDGKRLQPVCDPSTDNTSDKSRWIELVEVLNGTINNYRCETVSRRAPSFAVDFSLPDSIAPPDADYRTPYHRPMSGDCGVWPGTVTGTNLFNFDRPRFINQTSGSDCSASFTVGGDGLIDAYTSLMRFGIMTLDTLPNAGTGHLGPAGYSKNWATGSEGAFSYFYGSYASGKPVFCSLSDPMEVGVRNGAAPAWEGKMIAFGDPAAGSQATRHAHIKDVVLSTRPYGASPVAGALTDAMTFFWDDDSYDPLNPALKYGPRNDPYVQGGCRQQHIILLTDGEPNLDLRPQCAATVNPGGTPSDTLDGKCPFRQPVEIIAGLSQGSFTDMNGIPHSGKPVETHIVGFADGTKCETLSNADIKDAGGACATNNGADAELETCCRLHEMAYYGEDPPSGRRAFFADDQLKLKEGIGSILSSLVAGTASATQPVRSPGVGAADTTAKAYRILTSYTRTSDGLWHGNVERLRWTCNAGVPTEQAKDKKKGDDFNYNMSKDPTSLNKRVFMSFVADGGNSDRTLRPSLSGAPDGLGTLGGTQQYAAGAGIAAKIPFEAMSGGKTEANQIPACSDLGTGGLSACRDRVLDWALGYAPDANGDNHRCESPGSAKCSVIGDVLHSTPVIVNRPSAGVTDESYVTFMAEQKGRPMMAYTSSNDGQLHGFMVSPNDTTEAGTYTDDANNERFSFIPPAVLPLLASQYPNVRLKLLDAKSVVKDVVAKPSSSAAYPFVLERTLDDAQATDGNTWRTILVQSMGEAGTGYFALDITGVDPAVSTKTPRFLWQITTDDDATPAPIFGTGGTPLITTVSVNAGGTDVKEVAVAVLPGGEQAEIAGTCGRLSSGWTHIAPGFTPRASGRCYPDTSRARSVTIVRLDSGEILATFRNDTDPTVAGSITPGKVIVSKIDAPITGAPAAYPDGVGAVADRIFIGDRDGTLYKIDLSNPNPALWKMELFFDSMGAHPQKASRPAEISQPLRTAPALSTDDKGQLVIGLATGDQALPATAEKQYVWSITEAVNASGTGFDANPNWYYALPGQGEHVLGPLQLFNGAFYFATYVPPDATDAGAVACQAGESAIYGLHYLRPYTAGDLSSGGEHALKLASGTATNRLKATDLGLDANTVIFGVNLEYAPECYDVTEGSALFALGNKAKITGSSPPKAQLTFQTTNNAKPTSSSSLNFATNFVAVDLAQPRSVSTIESWAAILD